MRGLKFKALSFPAAVILFHACAFCAHAQADDAHRFAEEVQELRVLGPLLA